MYFLCRQCFKNGFYKISYILSYPDWKHTKEQLFSRFQFGIARWILKNAWCANCYDVKMKYVIHIHFSQSKTEEIHCIVNAISLLKYMSFWHKSHIELYVSLFSSFRSACTSWCMSIHSDADTWITYQVIYYLTWIREFTWHLALQSARAVFQFFRKVVSIASNSEHWEGLDLSTWDDLIVAMAYRNARFSWDKRRLFIKVSLFQVRA